MRQVVETAYSLTNIIQYELPALFRRQHINRKLKIGFIGLPGEGKSTSAAVTALLDGMLQGEPCWSNMNIKCTFDVADEVAEKYGLKGGKVAFAAEKLDKKKLLRMDEEYTDGWLLLDEINMEFGESRRAMSNTNLFFNRADQQLRHLRLGLIYTVIHEMWVDPRIRNLTDVFVRCEDPALTPQGLAQKRELGEEIVWTIYPMTRLLTGESYYQTQKPLPPIYVKSKQFWNIFDTYERQAAGQYKYGITSKELEGEGGTDLEIKQSQEVQKETQDWGWLYQKMTDLHQAGTEEIWVDELWGYLGVRERGISTQEVGRKLSAMGVTKKFHGSVGKFVYLIDNFDLNRIFPKGQNSTVLK